jgi:hypothetical protein
MARKAIYLSGWEYNRLLREDPTTPVTSGLPAEALWNGSAQFWLFEKVYCTKESLDGDLAGAHELGWTTGRIFEDLARRGFLEPVSWRELADKSPLLNDRLREVHTELRRRIDQPALLNLLRQGASDELEAIKLELMSPVLEHLGCVENISPNSITRWFSSAGNTGSENSGSDSIAAALSRSVREARLGMKLCNPPGTGVSRPERHQQRRVEEAIQKPMIPDLLAGVLSQDDYHRRLRETAAVYKPINEQLDKDYRAGIDRLERLRDLAKLHLWPTLHGDWLGRLEQEPEFLPEFIELVRDASVVARFDPYLETMTEIAIVAVSGGLGLTTALASTMAGVNPILLGAAAATAVGMTTAALRSIHGRRRELLRPLSLFYQKARSRTRRRVKAHDA